MAWGINVLNFSPATRCPVHIHVYRCDSNHTAAFLTQQLNTMAQRPDNQAKFREIEAKLSGRGLLHPPTGSHAQGAPNAQPARHGGQSDDQSSTSRTTNSSPGTSDSGAPIRPPGLGLPRLLANGQSNSHHPSSGPSQRPLANDGGHSAPHRLMSPQPPINGNHFFEGPMPQSAGSPMALESVNKLTAEFQQRLQTRDSTPILLPPKDYDTVNRSRGKIGLVLIPNEKEEEELFRRNVKREKSNDAGVQTSGRGAGGAADIFDSSNLVHRQKPAKLKPHHHFSTENILDLTRKGRVGGKYVGRGVESDDEAWQVDRDEQGEREEEEEEEDDPAAREPPIVVKLADFDRDLLRVSAKMFCMLATDSWSIGNLLGNNFEINWHKTMPWWMNSKNSFPVGNAGTWFWEISKVQNFQSLFTTKSVDWLFDWSTLQCDSQQNAILAEVCSNPVMILIFFSINFAMANLLSIFYDEFFISKIVSSPIAPGFGLENFRKFRISSFVYRLGNLSIDCLIGRLFTGTFAKMHAWRNMVDVCSKPVKNFVFRFLFGILKWKTRHEKCMLKRFAIAKFMEKKKKENPNGIWTDFRQYFILLQITLQSWPIKQSISRLGKGKPFNR